MDTERRDAGALLHRDVTEKIIKAFFDVHRELGFGFLESVYENALVVALESSGMRISRQVPVTVLFRGVAVGDFRIDLVIEDCVVVEVKTGSGIVRAHEAQLLNYLRATNLRVGLLLNFGNKAEFIRKVF